jgi:uncharacterized Fe-S cluster-containing radical SAM superfamily protein
MKKLIRIKISGSHSQSYFTGEDAEKDFFEAVKKAAETLQEKQLSLATVCLFENENDEHDKAIKKVELMRHK